MTEIINKINKFYLNELSEDWVQTIYDSEFLEYQYLPENYESLFETNEIYVLLQNTLKIITNWNHDKHEDEDNKSWTYLSQKIKYKTLLALLGYYIDQGSKNINKCGMEQINMAILASRLYYKLLSIPGYKAYNIYHSQLFTNSLSCLTYPKCMCDNEDSYFNTTELVKDVNFIIEQLAIFVIDLKHIVTNLQLSPTDMNFEDILSNFVEVVGGAILNKFNIDRERLSKVIQVVCDLINVIIIEVNGRPNLEAIQLLFKSILPKLIAASVDSRHNNNVIRSSYLTYSAALLRKYGNAAVPGYVVLIQHLCYTLDGLERVEVRNARVSLVTSLMDLLPDKSYRQTVKWILKLSTTSKVSHRHIAVELIAKLLTNDADPSGDARDGPPASHDNDEKVTLDDQKEVKSIAPDDEVHDKSAAESPNADDESSQDRSIHNDGEVSPGVESVLGVALAHTVSHAQLLRAVYERTHDASGTLRARALSLLADCADSPRDHLGRALKELEGDGEVSRLLSAAARCVCDERAAVRRAAAALVQRLLTSGDRSGRARGHAMLVGLCRDASIIVRVGAITALGELLLRDPCDELIDAFLTGPMHQLSDPESKVQEQVINLVQQILFDRLKAYDVAVAEEKFKAELPWLLLAGVVRHNMRRHLQKACTMLAKTNHINHRLVKVVSSHLSSVDEERDLQCLVLLTSVSRHVPCSDVGRLLDYYYRLEGDDTARDGRAAAMILELLGTWASGIEPELCRGLRERLLRRLACAPTDGEYSDDAGVAGETSPNGLRCRPACASLAAQLDPDNMNWATELMQISERRALAGGELEEWLRAADLSLVACAPPDPALLRLFLSALTMPPPEWCERRRAACVAGAGRLCVRSRGAASALAPPMARLLQDAAAPLAARHNALLALADVATRYSCIVEPLLPALCGCLAADAAPTLRRAAARALTRLLLAGFLRLRTPLYYTFCALLADEDHDVREPAEYYVTCCLTADAIFHHFVDCVIHYNKVDSERLSYDARQLIYDVMLQRLSLVQRLNVQCRLARELLAHAAELDGEPPAELHAALLDAITLLCGPRMRLPKKPEKSAEADDIDELQERVTTNIVSHKMKRTVAEVLVPAVLRLYANTRPLGGQLVAYLVRLATDLLNDYRQEIEELIENDEELVERVQQFQENIGLEPFGNTRNLVTASVPPEPDTPRAPRKRPARPAQATPDSRKRRLRYTHQ